MKKTFPEGCNEVRTGMGPSSQEVASYFGKIATVNRASVIKKVFYYRASADRKLCLQPVPLLHVTSKNI